MADGSPLLGDQTRPLCRHSWQGIIKEGYLGILGAATARAGDRLRDARARADGCADQGDRRRRETHPGGIPRVAGVCGKLVAIFP